jgi:hypothetical protein
VVRKCGLCNFKPAVGGNRIIASALCVAFLWLNPPWNNRAAVRCRCQSNKNDWLLAWFKASIVKTVAVGDRNYRIGCAFKKSRGRESRSLWGAISRSFLEISQFERCVRGCEKLDPSTRWFWFHLRSNLHGSRSESLRGKPNSQDGSSKLQKLRRNRRTMCVRFACKSVCGGWLVRFKSITNSP